MATMSDDSTFSDNSSNIGSIVPWLVTAALFIVVQIWFWLPSETFDDQRSSGIKLEASSTLAAGSSTDSSEQRSNRTLSNNDQKENSLTTSASEGIQKTSIKIGPTTRNIVQKNGSDQLSLEIPNETSPPDANNTSTDTTTTLKTDNIDNNPPPPTTTTIIDTNSDKTTTNGNNKNNWRCVCEVGFLPPGMLQTFGGTEAIIKLGMGECYHKQS